MRRADVPAFSTSKTRALPPRRQLLDGLTNHVTREVTFGGDEAATETNDRDVDVYDAVAAQISARRDGIAFVECAIRAWD